MRIGIIGKYPPIQGGVSRAVYQTSHELAKQGHEVHVITNAEEVEPNFRLILTPGDRKRMTRKYKTGRVEVHNLDPIRFADFGHIPLSPAFETRMMAKGREILALKPFDVLIGWYFQPYGVVAGQLSQEFNIPLILLHAGSDIGRLSRNPNLRSAYKTMLSQADCILSNWDSEPGRLLKQLGVPKEKVVENKGGNFLGDFFSVQPKPLNLEKYKSKAAPWIKGLGISPEVEQIILGNNQQEIDLSLPVLAIFGKVGEVKGSFDLINVLSQLADEGLKFNFLTIPLGGKSALKKYFSEISANENLARQTFVMPPIAPWKIPRFIAACDAAFFLERGFDLEFHTPHIPMEIMAGGAALICSKEIIDQQFFEPLVLDGNNYIEIADPKDHAGFKAKIQPFLSKKKLASIGRRGRLTYEAIEKEMPATYSVVKNLNKAFAKIKKRKSRLKPLKEVLKYKNDFVIECFLKDYEMPLNEAQDLFKETLKWLYLGAFSEENGRHNYPYLGLLESNVILDKMWHSFVLATHDYQRFCLDYLGRFIHHQPGSAKDKAKFEKELRKHPRKAFKRRKKELKEVVGFVYDVLGPETVKKWYVHYPKKYPFKIVQPAPIKIAAETVES